MLLLTLLLLPLWTICGSSTDLKVISVSGPEVSKILTLALETEADIWRFNGTHLDVALSAALENKLADLGDLPLRVIHENLTAAIEEQFKQVQGSEADDFFDNWRTLSEYTTWMQDLAKDYASLVTLSTMGSTYRALTVPGQPIQLLKISGSSGASKRIVFNGCQHAREWVSPATVAYLAYNLVTRYDSEPFIKQIVDEIEWYIIPIVNVDGFAYTWQGTSERMWRKNRQPNSASSTTGTGSSCMGTDTNRNWGYKWGTGGSSSNPCSETYMGEAAFSSPEAKALGQFVENLNSNNQVKAYIDFHAYGDMWMTPWGYSSAYPADYDLQIFSANGVTAAIRGVYGEDFATGTVYRVIYQASGGSNDYTYSVGVPLSFAVELRGDSFVIPASNIRKSGEEVWAGLLVLAQDVLDLN